MIKGMQMHACNGLAEKGWNDEVSVGFGFEDFLLRLQDRWSGLWLLAKLGAFASNEDYTFFLQGAPSNKDTVCLHNPRSAGL